MQRKCTLLVLIVLLSVVAGAQTSIKNLPKLQADSTRWVVIKIDAQWCMYCKLQDEILKDEALLAEINKHFYYCHLDAESKEEIVFNHRTYVFVPNGPAASAGIHELAYELANENGQVHYPTWVLLDEHCRVMKKVTGLLRKKQLKEFLEME